MRKNLLVLYKGFFVPAIKVFLLAFLKWVAQVRHITSWSVSLADQFLAAQESWLDSSLKKERTTERPVIHIVATHPLNSSISLVSFTSPLTSRWHFWFCKNCVGLWCNWIPVTQGSFIRSGTSSASQRSCSPLRGKIKQIKECSGRDVDDTPCSAASVSTESSNGRRMI